MWHKIVPMPVEVQAGRLWSLREMLHINGPLFMGAVSEVVLFKQLLNNHTRQEPGSHMGLGAHRSRHLVLACECLLEIVEGLGANVAAKDLRTLRDFINEADRKRIGDPNQPDLIFIPELSLHSLKTVCDRCLALLDDVLDRSVFLAIDPRLVPYWTKEGTVSDEVIAMFPDGLWDIEEAAKCIAVERNTASVFHSMRALEVPIKHLCGKMKLNPSNPNWENVLNDLNKSILGMDRTWGSDWKHEQHKYAAAVAHMKLYQRAWRNYVVHGTEHYGGEEARQILSSVKGFFRELA